MMEELAQDRCNLIAKILLPQPNNLFVLVSFNKILGFLQTPSENFMSLVHLEICLLCVQY